MREEKRRGERKEEERRGEKRGKEERAIFLLQDRNRFYRKLLIQMLKLQRSRKRILHKNAHTHTDTPSSC